MNKVVQRIPQQRSFRIGKKRIIKEEIVKEVADDDEQALDESLNIDESRDLDNRMCGDKILRILRDYIIKENIHIRTAFGVENITQDKPIYTEDLKNKIKSITGAEATYDEIMKAIDHFHRVSFEKKRERNVMNVEPGQQGYILNRNEAQTTIKDEIQMGFMNFKDFEIQLRD